MNTAQTIPFSDIKAVVRTRFADMLKKSEQTDHALLKVDYDRDVIWSTYLDAFIDPVERQEHNCNCCKSFIRQVGGAILVHPNLAISSLWDSESPSPGVRALAAYVLSRPIAGLFYHEGSSAGTDRNFDAKRQIEWNHFHLTIPRNFINNERTTNVLGRKSAEARTLTEVFLRGVTELSSEAIETVQELISSNQLYRGPEYKNSLDEFARLRTAMLSTPEDLRQRRAWLIVATTAPQVLGIRNSAIGTLLVDLSSGRDVDASLSAYERITAPANYKRPTAAVTPRMVEAAKQTLFDLGYLSALDRRRLDDRDLTAANALFVYRPTVKKGADVFAEVVEDTPVNVKELSRVDVVPAAIFVSEILPTAKGIRVLPERGHLGNFATLTGPVDVDAPSLMKWDNSFAWSFTGGVADAIKERVKAAGGKVDGWMRASLGWNNYDDLDLHFKGGGEHVYFANNRGQQAWLDVDMNAGWGRTREPVENITFNRQLEPGKYEIRVNQYSRRESVRTGYTLEIEVNGEVHSFGNAKSPKTGDSHVINFKVLPDGQVAFEGGDLVRSSAGVTKWGITTGQLHRVRAVTLSPNHWTRPIGNKILFFLLEGCVSDEQTRPFYNEFLVDALSKDRKTMEVLAGKIKVAPAEGAELSGLGFSETQPNHLYVEVETNFKRIIKVQF